MTRLAQLLLGASVLCWSGSAAAQTAPRSAALGAAPLKDSAAPADGAGGAPSQAALQTASSQIEEVVVTASRRDETIRDTPLAVSAYSGERMADRQLVSLPDLVATSPNVQISTFLTNANVSIRGIGNTQITAGADSGVAVHADNVYLGQSSLVLSTLLDVARVEILRGPQGTLFGRNATGGAINILPNLPSATPEFGVDLTGGVDPALVRSSMYASGPLNDDGTLRGRFSAQENWSRGFSRNLSPTGPRRLDDPKTVSARGQLQWLPSPDFTVRLLVEYQKENDSGGTAYLLGTPDPMQALPLPLQGQPSGDPEDRTAYANVGKKDLEAKTVNLSLSWAVAGGELRALASHNATDTFVLQDGDGTAANFTSSTFDNRAQQYYGEVLYASDPMRPLSFIVGANYFTEHFTQYVDVPVSTLGVTISLGGSIRTTSYAGFAHAEYAFLPGAKLLAGLRYSHDEKSIDEYNNFLGTLSQSDDWSRLTYDVGLSYEFSPSLTGYLRYATGYKGGGFSAGALGPSFDPEKDRNLELGLKGVFLDGAVSANFAAFHTKYRDLQVNQVVGVLSQVTNAARATIDGAELEIVAKPSDSLRLELSSAWLDARFDEFLTQDSARPALGLLSLKGNRLPQAPKFNTSAGAYYDIPLGDGTLTAGARYDWRDRTYFSEFNLPVSSQSDAGKLDLSLRWRSGDAHWTANVFALNVFDRRVKSNVTVVSALLGSLAVAGYQPGRQVGMSIGYRY